jgi:4-hydroxybenzoate polyprenyltransferase
MRAIWALIRCSHPEPVAAVTALAGILALTAGRGAGTVWVVLAVLSGQLFVGWTNDYLDRERDRAAGRRDKPLTTREVDAKTVRTAAVAALLAAIPLSLASGLPATAVHFTAIAAATAYNLGLKFTPVSVAPYVVAFALLPAFITLGLPDARSHLPPGWAVAAGGLIGAGGHFSQVLPDIKEDRKQGIRGLPQLLGERPSAIAAALLLGGAAVVIATGTGNAAPVPAAIACAGAIVITGARGRTRTAFRLTLVAAAVTVLAFVLGGSSLGAQ